ncbi:uncharacterized protein LOC111490263 [Cucurbita maxima]|uniref:Uncharacterized protein LOC111490263 n=1 Tax=Cucurbita maxima TaxID=3661 RepID=A0A6J1K1Q4_CUCMA|nr:uncharacterized protein LOC111490263 [Cucurbita maxima]
MKISGGSSIPPFSFSDVSIRNPNFSPTATCPPSQRLHHFHFPLTGTGNREPGIGNREPPLLFSNSQLTCFVLPILTDRESWVWELFKLSMLYVQGSESLVIILDYCWERVDVFLILCH